MWSWVNCFNLTGLWLLMSENEEVELHDSVVWVLFFNIPLILNNKKKIDKCDKLDTCCCCCCCEVASVVSDSVRPQRWQPTRLPRPWDSPGKNTGVGCHFLLQCMTVKNESEVAQSCPTLSDQMDCSLPGSSVHGIFQARVLEWGAIAFSKIRYIDDRLDR